MRLYIHSPVIRQRRLGLIIDTCGVEGSRGGVRMTYRQRLIAKLLGIHVMEEALPFWSLAPNAKSCAPHEKSIVHLQILKCCPP